MKSALIKLGILAVIFTGCKKDNEITKTIDFDKFTLDTPSDWKRFYPQGTDGFFGGLTNRKDTLYFDYGIFSYTSVDSIKQTSETLSFEALVINSYDAKIVKEKRAGEDQIRFSMYVDKKDNVNRNRIYGYGIKDEGLIRRMFLTHKFK